jgi:hypothetical protein
MKIYQIDPLSDGRWAELVQHHSSASVFHTVAWLKTLRRTYGYQPVVFTTSPPTSELKNGLVFCRVNSWLTGRRLVSLPFSDHCEPLCDTVEEMNFLIRYLQAALDHREWQRLELRPIEWNFREAGDGITLQPDARYYFHTLDLRPELANLFHNFDKDNVQRRIQRAERAGLVEQRGRSEALLKDFYSLFVATRGRHRLPPIPRAWFSNLIESLGDAVEIRVAYQDETPIASVLTLQFRDVVYYKYGCSDARFNRFGAMPWLLWRAVEAAKSNGGARFDLGRTEEDNAGLLAFKNHWVPQPRHLVYWKFPNPSSLNSITGWKLKMAKMIFSCMPESVLAFTGRMIYRHIG